jgi:hypothetical protein
MTFPRLDRIPRLLRREPLLWAIATLALVYGAYLRFDDLGAHSLWTDELSTWSRQAPPIWGAVFWERVWADVHPPGYLMLMQGWCAVFGVSEVALRTPSALAGISLIAAVFALSRRLWGLEAAVLAAVLSSLSQPLLYYSQEARSFIPSALAAILAAHALVNLMSAPGDDLRSARRGIITTAVLGALASYLHYIALLSFATCLGFALLWCVLRQRAQLARVGACCGLTLLLYTPWLPGLVHHISKGGLSWLQRPEFEDLYALPGAALPPYVYLSACLLIGGGALMSSREQTETTNAARFGGPLLLWWVVSLAAALWLKSKLSSPILNSRNVVPLMPPLIALVAGAVSRAAAPRSWKLGWLGVCAGLMVYQLFYVDEHYDNREEENFRDIVAQGVKWAKRYPDAPLVAFGNPEYMNYYLDRLGSSARVEHGTKSGKQLRDVLRKHYAGAPRAIVLAAHFRLNRNDYRAIEKNYKIDEKKAYRIDTKKRNTETVALLLERKPAKASRKPKRRKQRKGRPGK